MPDCSMKIGTPVISAYFNARNNTFLNTRVKGAPAFEESGNAFLWGYRYLFTGRDITVIDNEDGILKSETSFDYSDHVLVQMLKTIAAILTLPICLLLGAILKGIAYICEGTRRNHALIEREKIVKEPVLNNERYEKIGGVSLFSDEEYRPTVIVPKPALTEEQIQIVAAFKEIVAVLDESKIPYFVSWGSQLGIHRHEGMIPWDNDIDISILEDDHENIFRALRNLPERFQVQDWSPAHNPKSLIKVQVKDICFLFDFYHNKIVQEEGKPPTIQYNFAHKHVWYFKHLFSQAFYDREARVGGELMAWGDIFPLKWANFDGVKVRVPNKPENYLHMVYGDNLNPAKIWDPAKKEYVNDENHPYWKGE